MVLFFIEPFPNTSFIPTFPPSFFSSSKDPVFCLLPNFFLVVVKVRTVLTGNGRYCENWQVLSAITQITLRPVKPADQQSSIQGMLVWYTRYGGVQVFTSVRSYPPCYSVTHPVPPNLLPLSSLTSWHSHEHIIPHFPFVPVVSWNKNPERMR